MRLRDATGSIDQQVLFLDTRTDQSHDLPRTPRSCTHYPLPRRSTGADSPPDLSAVHASLVSIAGQTGSRHTRTGARGARCVVITPQTSP